METFIVTVTFHDWNLAGVAVAVLAATKQDATDKAFDWFAETDSVEEAHAQTIAEFEADYGRYEPGMFALVK